MTNLTFPQRLASAITGISDPDTLDAILAAAFDVYGDLGGLTAAEFRAAVTIGACEVEAAR